MSKFLTRFLKSGAMLAMVFLGVAFSWTAHGLTMPPSPGPSSRSTGLQGTISAPPPSQAATITTPGNGQSFTNNPITVAGLCPAGTLVKVFSNNIFVGSTSCSGGSFSLKADLFNGRNDILARVYDALGQQGPDSGVVSVTFTSSAFAQFGTLLSLTSSYAERGVNPGQQLTWPITINGGSEPYAMSVNWGDGSQADLLSVSFSGNVTIAHTYQNAGTYTLLIEATDKNGETAFLQLVAVVAGSPGQTAAGSANKSNSNSGGQTSGISRSLEVIVGLAVFILLLLAFWLGRRHELFSLRKNLENSRLE